MSRSPVTAVVAPMPHGNLRGRERVQSQRVHARYAVQVSAARVGAGLGSLDKDSDDVPLPSNGWHWSLSHCASSVAGVVHTAPVGIDVEDRRDVRAGVIERVLAPDEMALFERRGEVGFLRAWTAKEALLKEHGIGIAGLSRCKVVAVEEHELVLEFDGRRRSVNQLVERDRVVSVSSRDGTEVIFEVLRAPFPDPAGSLRWTS